MTFIDLSLGNPVVQAQNTITGELGAIGARFIMAGASPRAMAEGGPTADFRPIAGGKRSLSCRISKGRR